MEPKQFHRRVLAVVLALALAYGALGSELYDLQVNNGAELRRKSQYKIAETETVEAARGQILDRNGKVLVSNKVIYQVTLNTKLMGDNRNNSTDSRNEAVGPVEERFILGHAVLGLWPLSKLGVL